MALPDHRELQDQQVLRVPPAQELQALPVQQVQPDQQGLPELQDKALQDQPDQRVVKVVTEQLVPPVQPVSQDLPGQQEPELRALPVPQDQPVPQV